MPSGLLLALLLTAAPAADAAPHRLPPVDQCASDRSFVAFRNALRAAIARRDRAFILATVADNIEVDFGGGAGRATFARTWRLDRPQSSRLWDELGRVLALGCARSQGEFYAPAMAVTGDDVFEDPFTQAVAIRPNAEVRAAADAASRVVATLAWDIVTVPEWAQDAAWQRVELADGRTGYMRSTDLRSPIDYRAAFRRIGGRWRMTAFIAGD